MESLQKQNVQAKFWNGENSENAKLFDAIPFPFHGHDSVGIRHWYENARNKT